MKHFSDKVDEFTLFSVVYEKYSFYCSFASMKFYNF